MSIRVFRSPLNVKDNGLLASLPLSHDGVSLTGVRWFVSLSPAGDMGLNGVGSGPRRASFLESQGIDASRLATVSMAHTRDVVLAKSAGAVSGAADGLATRVRDLGLSITVGDCLPICLFDTEHEALALLHSGWRGTGIVVSALDLMSREWGTRPSAVAASLGPCIGSCCYSVDAERARAFDAEFGAPAQAVGERAVRFIGTQPFLDLQGANIGLLAGQGVRSVAVCEACTYDDKRLGSFRREGAGTFTRMMAVAVMDSVDDEERKND